MNDQRRMFDLMAGQHGLASRRQLLELGLTDDRLFHLLSAGWLEEVHRGVYRVGGHEHSPRQRDMAACLAVGGLVAASHRSAARLWGLDTWRQQVTEVTVCPSRSSRRTSPARTVIVHRCVDLTADQITQRQGVPVTDPCRLLVDLGAVMPKRAVEDALDDLIGRKLVTVESVRARLARLSARGRSGCGVLREVLDHRCGGELTLSRSRLEGELARLCDRAGLPPLLFQHEVVVGGRRRRLDFALPSLRLAIEVDGYESHSRFDVFEDDRQRANDLQLAGWTVLHFTWAQVTKRPVYVIAALRTALAGVQAA